MDSFRIFLLDLSGDVTKDMLKKIKFLCGSSLSKAELEDCDALELLEKLWARDYINESEVQFLVEIFTTMKCPQLVDKVTEYSKLFVDSEPTVPLLH